MNFYNEHDPKAAAWLRELIKQKQIPAGHVAYGIWKLARAAKEVEG